jgi:ribulose-bisphosphate carboxylase large chain
MPVFSSGQSVHQADGTYAGLNSTDLLVTAGGGIMAHPSGPAAGVQALREAWEAAVTGVSLASAAELSENLRLAAGIRA